MQLRGARTGLIAVVALAGAAVLTVLLLGRPAGASLSAAAPADRGTVGPPPSAVSLTFTAPVTEAHLAVAGAASRGAPAISGNTVSQPVAITAPGRYVVGYHVRTRGGDVAGTVTFTVTGSAAGGRPPPPPSADPAPAAGGHQHGGGVDFATATVIGVNLLVLLVLCSLFLRRSPRRSSPSDPPDGSARRPPEDLPVGVEERVDLVARDHVPRRADVNVGAARIGRLVDHRRGED